MDKKRVVITGMGVLSPLGNDPASVWEKASQGHSGIAPITAIDTSDILIKYGGEVRDFNPADWLDKREIRRTDRYTQFAIAAANRAIADSGLIIDDEKRWQIGVIIGTGIGPVTSLQEVFDQFRTGGHRNVKPLSVLMTLSDSPAARISISHGLMGTNHAVISACAAGNDALGESFHHIRSGRAVAMIAGGAEAALHEMVVSGFNNMKTLSHHEDPTSASRPFSVDRDGFVPAEGVGMFVLEELEHAKARGAHIYAEISGYGATSDAFHVTAPDETGTAAAQAMTLAMQDAGLRPDQVDYINAHGTSTPLNDRAETIAIKKAFGDAAYQVPISSTKSMTGHGLGATPGIEAVICLKALEHNFMPPTINLHHPDPECDLDYIPNIGREKPLSHIMSNAFGFGGHNAVIIFSRYQG